MAPVPKLINITGDELKEVYTRKFLQASNQNQKDTPIHQVHLFGNGGVVLYSPTELCTLEGKTFWKKCSTVYHPCSGGLLNQPIDYNCLITVKLTRFYVKNELTS